MFSFLVPLVISIPKISANSALLYTLFLLSVPFSIRGLSLFFKISGFVFKIVVRSEKLFFSPSINKSCGSLSPCKLNSKFLVFAAFCIFV